MLREFLIGRSALDRKLRTAAADSKLVEITKISQKLDRKIREIDLSYLCQQQRQIFEMNFMKRNRKPETEMV